MGRDNPIGIVTGLTSVIEKRSLRATRLHATAISRTATTGARLPTPLMREKKPQNAKNKLKPFKFFPEQHRQSQIGKAPTDDVASVLTPAHHVRPQYRVRRATCA